MVEPPDDPMAAPSLDNPLDELREIRDEEIRWKQRWEEELRPRRDWLIRYAAVHRRASQETIAQAAGRSQSRIQRILKSGE